MPNFIQKNMGMITMVAAVITALILALPMIGIQLPTREGGNEALACAMTAGSNMVGFDVSQCAMFEMMYADCSPSSGTILVTQGSYKDQSFNTDGVCNLNDKANNRMYFESTALSDIVTYDDFSGSTIFGDNKGRRLGLAQSFISHEGGQLTGVEFYVDSATYAGTIYISVQDTQTMDFTTLSVDGSVTVPAGAGTYDVTFPTPVALDAGKTYYVYFWTPPGTLNRVQPRLDVTTIYPDGNLWLIEENIHFNSNAADMALVLHR